jgi:ribonuclease III
MTVHAPLVTKERKVELNLFQKHAHIRFRSLELLNLAFCHRSFINEQSETGENNERLEFLGDSVLGLVVAAYLYEIMPDRQEGELARVKSFVVSEESLSEIARDLKIDNFILIGKGEEYSGGRNKKALLADATEAIIGAFFLDSGYTAAEKFVLRNLVPQIEKVLQNKHHKDFKTLLQEYVQKKFKTYPRYTLLKKIGPDHDRTFVMDVTINGRTFGSAQGKNKKEAEQNAAQIAYEQISGEDD